MFRSYYAPLCDFVYRYVRSRAESEEVVDDLFAWIWEHRGTWVVHGQLRTYLFGAARNRAFNALRHSLIECRWRASVMQECVLPGCDVVGAVVSNDAEERLAREPLMLAVGRVVQQLPKRCRMAIALRWHRQLSHGEIAEAMGISIKTVEIYLARGFKALRAASEELRAAKE